MLFSITCKWLLVAITVLALSVTSSLSASAHTPDGHREHYTIGGDACSTRNPAVKSIRRINGSLRNVSEQNTFNIACPIPAITLRPEVLPGDSFHPRTDISVFIFFHNSGTEAQSLRCKFSVGNSVEGAGTEIIHPDGLDDIGFTFEEVYSDKVLISPLTATCLLPPHTEIKSVNVFYSEPELE